MYKLIANQIDYVTEEEAYQHLAKGIIIQAIEDYRRVLNGETLYNYGRVERDRGELENFFKSQWCYALGDWDGVAIMQIIQKQEKKK